MSSEDFTVQYELPLNPGMNTFPWLATIARRFQEFKFRGVVFHYIPASGTAVASTNSALGTVMMQTTYRPSDTAPTAKIEMLNEYCANEVVPCESAIHPIECDPKQNPFAIQFVRATAVPAGESVLNYDLGKTFIATQGQQAAGNYLGDVWVTYEVELMKPVYSSPVTINPLSEFDSDSATTTDYFVNTTYRNDNLDLVLAGTSVAFPSYAGTTFVLMLHFLDGAATAVTWGAASVSNGTLNWTRRTDIAGGPAQPMIACCFTKTDPSKPSTVTLPPMTALTGTINQTELHVVRAG